jgi:parallel beta-helix repeat protein
VQFHSRAIIGLVVALCVAAGLQPARAQIPQAFIASTGDDTHSCQETAPCRSFAKALTAVQAQGEITVLDTANYGPVIITKSISIVATGQASVVDQSFCVNMVAPCATISIVAGATDVVTLRGLVLDGSVTSNTSGVLIYNAARVNIENCAIYNSSNPGIYVVPSTASQPVTLASTIDLNVQDTTVSRNTTAIKITAVPGVLVNATISNSNIVNNSGGGVRIDGSTGGAITATIADSRISLNGGNGVNAVGGTGTVLANLTNDILGSNAGAAVQANGGSATVAVSRSTLSNNGSAWSNVGGATLLSFGNNEVTGPIGTPPSHASFQ